MKKVIAGVAFLFVAASLSMKTSSAQTIIITEGKLGCITTPGSNVGQCKKNVNGREYNCVSASWWQKKDCSGDQ